MKSETILAGARDLGRRNAMMAALLGVSVVTNLALAVTIPMSKQTILIPTMASDFSVSGTGGVSREYLEMLARDAAFVFLNRNPQSEEFFDRQVERMTHPETYGEIKKALIGERLSRQENRASQVFYPSSFFVDPKELYVEVSGKLDTINSREIIKTEDKIFALRFERQGSLVLLTSFVPLSRDEQRGSKVRPTTVEGEM